MHVTRKATWLLIAVFGLAIVGGVYRFTQILGDPDVVLLVPEQHAEWIGVDEPLSFFKQPEGSVRGHFRKSFAVRSAPPNAVLDFRALKSAAIFMDGEPVFLPNEHLADWKTTRHVDLAGRILPGHHVLEVVVRNENGPVGLVIHSRGLALSTDGSWESSRDGERWTVAKRLAELRLEPLSRRFPRADQAVADCLPFLAPLFAAAFFLTLWLQSESPRPRWLRAATSPSGVRWLLVAAWALMTANNTVKVPTHLGFDVVGHVEYVHYVAKYVRIPLANEGWQMFQSPLYYVLLAPCYKLLGTILPHQSIWIWRLLRLASFVCGGIQIELCFRTLKLICRGRENLQVLGTVLGGLLPMNIHISQAVGNEPLAGLFSAVVVLLGTKTLCVVGSAESKSHLRWLGLFLGLAMLTKVTAVLLAALVGVVVPYALLRDGKTLRQAAAGCATVFGIAAVISAWYYVRNWIELGRPFVGGWDSSRGIVWWQDPGYRVPGHFLTFGQSLVYPIYSGACGFWDALYSTFWLDGWLSSVCAYEDRPPWNYLWMITGSWLAVIPSTGIVVGCAVAFFRSRPECAAGLRFAVVSIAVYLAALAVLFLQLPIYSTAKATYTLGLVPCYAALGSVGLGVLMRGPFSRAAVSAWMTCWAASAYMAFFVQ